MTMTMSTGKKALIFVTLAIYVVHLVLNGLSARGSPDDPLFPNTVSDVSDAFKLEITPVGATFSIWGAIFTYQLAWLIYACTTVCRTHLASTNIISAKFYVVFIINILFISAWLFVWARKMVIASLVVILLGQFFVNSAIGIALYDLKMFLDDQKVLNRSKADVWSIRILMQNGLLFYATWTTVASLLNLAMVISYKGSLSTHTASLISISTLGGLAVIWFILESFIIQEYTEFTFTPYITLIIANTGIYAANNKSSGVEVFKWISLGLIILSAVLLIVRVVIIVIRTCKKEKKSKEEMAYPSYSMY